MRSFRCRAGLLGVTTLTLVGLIALAGDAGALQKVAPKKFKETPGSTVGSLQMLAGLEEVRKLVHDANHDYRGLRSQAGSQIRFAIHTLDPNRKHPTLPLAKNDKSSQSLSDVKLEQAVKQLQNVQTLMEGSSNQQIITANTHVANAIKTLKAALKQN